VARERVGHARPAIPALHLRPGRWWAPAVVYRIRPVCQRVRLSSRTCVRAIPSAAGRARTPHARHHVGTPARRPNPEHAAPCGARSRAARRTPLGLPTNVDGRRAPREIHCSRVPSRDRSRAAERAVTEQAAVAAALSPVATTDGGAERHPALQVSAHQSGSLITIVR
jgi:hypothetical protein